jgi:protein-tyrosine phosphatase
MKKILFVCLGNICRSPMAEGLMKKMIKDQELEKWITVESRATSSYEIGRPPHPKTMAILSREGAELTAKKAEQIKKEDFDSFDYIIGMDDQNVEVLKKMANQHAHKVYLFRDIDPNTQGEQVPDPYYSGKYEETFGLIQQSLIKWLEHLKKTEDCY